MKTKAQLKGAFWKVVFIVATLIIAPIVVSYLFDEYKLQQEATEVRVTLIEYELGRVNNECKEGIQIHRSWIVNPKNLTNVELFFPTLSKGIATAFMNNESFYVLTVDNIGKNAEKNIFGKTYFQGAPSDGLIKDITLDKKFV